MNNILIAIPTMGQNDYRFTLSLASLIIPENSSVMAVPRVMIDTARNLFCQKFLEDKEKTHLFFLDDDMTFDSDILMRLLEHDVDIIGALAFKRVADYQPCVYQKNPEDNNYYPIIPKEMQEVDVIGTAGFLIKRNVIESMKNPWFETPYTEDGKHFSVDFNFCMKAKEAGFKIWCDPTIEMKHIGEAPLIGKQEFLQHVSKNFINKQKNDSLHK